MSAEWKAGVTTVGSLAVWDGDNWRWGASGQRFGEQPPANMRPLVLIDPEDREQVHRLLAGYHEEDAEEPQPSHLINRMQAALREYASPTPRKPDEPMGLGAVVVDEDGIKWVRADDDSAPWTCGGDVWSNYADISAVEVLSAGVES